jgi:hypothetical protein
MNDDINTDPIDEMTEAETKAVDEVRRAVGNLVLAKYDTTPEEFVETLEGAAFAGGTATITLSVIWPDFHIRMALHEKKQPSRVLLEVTLERKELFHGTAH